MLELTEYHDFFISAKYYYFQAYTVLNVLNKKY